MGFLYYSTEKGRRTPTSHCDIWVLLNILVLALLFSAPAVAGETVREDFVGQDAILRTEWHSAPGVWKFLMVNT